MIQLCLLDVFYYLLYDIDISITGDDVDGIAALKIEFACCFAKKDLASLHYFLGIEVASSPKGYILSQSKYRVDIFECTLLLIIRLLIYLL